MKPLTLKAQQKFRQFLDLAKRDQNYLVWYSNIEFQWHMEHQAVAELQSFETTTGHTESLVFTQLDFC
jgi:hypothetical protein